MDEELMRRGLRNNWLRELREDQERDLALELEQLLREEFDEIKTVITPWLTFVESESEDEPWENDGQEDPDIYLENPPGL